MSLQLHARQSLDHGEGTARRLCKVTSGHFFLLAKQVHGRRRMMRYCTVPGVPGPRPWLWLWLLLSKTNDFIKMINSLSKTDDFIKMINSLSKTDDFIKTDKFS